MPFLDTNSYLTTKIINFDIKRQRNLASVINLGFRIMCTLSSFRFWDFITFCILLFSSAPTLLVQVDWASGIALRVPTFYVNSYTTYREFLLDLFFFGLTCPCLACFVFALLDFAFYDLYSAPWRSDVLCYAYLSYLVWPRVSCIGDRGEKPELCFLGRFNFFLDISLFRGCFNFFLNILVLFLILWISLSVITMYSNIIP